MPKADDIESINHHINPSRSRCLRSSARVPYSPPLLLNNNQQHPNSKSQSIHPDRLKVPFRLRSILSQLVGVDTLSLCFCFGDCILVLEDGEYVSIPVWLTITASIKKKKKVQKARDNTIKLKPQTSLPQHPRLSFHPYLHSPMNLHTVFLRYMSCAT